MECELVPFNGKTIFFAYGAIEIVVQPDFVEIDHLAAAAANKVGMGRCICIEPLLPVDHAHTVNHTVLLEEFQIPVYRSQTEVGVAGLQSLIDPVGRGMAGRTLYGVQDRFALFTVADSLLQVATSLSLTVIVYDMIVSHWSAFVKSFFEKIRIIFIKKI